MCSVWLQIQVSDHTPSGFATGILSGFRLFGGSVGTSVYTTIFQREAAKLLPGRVSAAAATAGLPNSSMKQFLTQILRPGGSVTGVPGVTQAVLQAATLAIKESYISAFKLVWYTSAAFGGLTLVAALLSKDVGFGY
jgi:hypothetical protein